MALPSEYIQLEYIKSTGKEWIDTEFTPDSNTRVVAEVETTTKTSSSNRWVFGCRSESLTQRFEVIYVGGASAFRFYFNTSNYTFSGVTLGHLNIDVSANSATINGVTVTPTGTFAGAGPIYIFSCNSSSVSSETFEQAVKIFKIYDNGTLARDFVPVMRKSDGELGLYDLVNNKFHGNVGAGAFVAGPVAGPNGSRALIDAVNYQIKSGKCEISGVVYGNYQGKVMVDGVVYDILLEPPAPTEYRITIVLNSAYGETNNAYVTVNGIKYRGSGETTIQAGETITLTVKSDASSGETQTGVYVNNEIIHRYSGSYAYTPSCDITVELRTIYYDYAFLGQIYITTN